MYKVYDNDYRIFNIDNELKQEYLDNKPTATAESDSFILRDVDEYEGLIGKSIYNMTYYELKEMIVMQFKNSSKKTVMKNISILKTYVDFCINQHVVLHGENRLAMFSSEDIEEFINQQAFEGKYLSKEELRECQDLLYNEQDKLFLQLLFMGVRGRTTEDGTLEELINLRMCDVDKEKKMLRLTQNDGSFRFLEVDEYTIDLVVDAYEQEYYIENNGELTNNPRLSEPRKSIINKVEDYVFRNTGKKKYEIFTSNLFTSRMRRIKIWLGLPFLSMTSVFMSGMIHDALEIYKKKGEVTKYDYIKICVKFNYGLNNNFESQYWFLVKELFEKYLELKIRKSG